MQETLYIRLRLINRQHVELRFSHDVGGQYRSLIRPLSGIEQLIQHTESTYNTAFPGRLDQLGQRLYRWLNGESDQFLARAIQDVRRQMESQHLVLAIDTDQRLAHLPWELLHDGKGFLIESRKPTILPVRWREGSLAPSRVENRPLRVLFMATSPVDVAPVLDFEQEEALILASTQRQKLSLIVEESGNLSELRYLVSEYGASGRFDVFHLNGHATLLHNGPRFYTESETGEAHLATAEELWESLPFPPRVIFLSGCSTGAMGDQGAVASLAQRLIDQGAGAVLGWARRVRDDQAAQAAATLYDALAMGHGLAMALSKTYQDLLAQEYENWHLLRLFVSGAMPEALVTEPRRPGRSDPLFLKHGTTFLNQREKRGEVADYKSFVGRRRVLQECLKILKAPESEYAGILLWGMGGVGKSSLANRIVFRVRDTFKPILLTDRYNNVLDIQKVRTYLAREIREPDLRQLLLPAQQGDGISRYRSSVDADAFAYVLRDVLEQTQERLLFLIDDFEGNFVRQADGAILLSADGTPEIGLEALDALTALVKAVLETQEKGHRLIITSRYQIHSAESEYLLQRQVTRLEPADVTKKLQRLDVGRRPLSPELGQQIARRADGNPRFLEWLYKLSAEPDLQIQAHLEAEQERFKEDIFIRQILAQLAPAVRELLGRIAVFELPVPGRILHAICADLDPEANLEPAVALGLLEAIAPVQPHEEPQYCVSQIIAGELPRPGDEVYRKAAELAHQTWVVSAAADAAYSPVREARNHEVYRLAKIVKAPRALLDAARALCTLWYQTGKNYREIVRLCQDVLAQGVAVDYQIYTYLASSMFETGERYREGEHELDGFAILDKALASCAPEDLKARAEVLISYAFWLKDYGNLNRALELSQQAEKLSARLEDQQTRIAALHQLACIRCDLGHFDRGEELFREAELLSRALPSAESMTAFILLTDTAASLYGRDLNRGKARQALEASNAFFEKSGALLHSAATRFLLARIHVDGKVLTEATKLCEQAVELFKRAGSLRGEAYALMLAASVDTALDQADRAIERYLKAIEIGKKLGHMGVLATGHMELGEFRLGREEFDEAERHFRAALDCCRTLDNDLGTLNAYLKLTQLAITRKEGVPAAVEDARAMLARLQSHDYPLHIVAALNQLGDAYKANEEYEQARRYYQQALDIRVHANYPGLSYAQYQLAHLYVLQEHWDEALQLYQTSLAIDIKNENADSQIVTLEAIADVYARQSRYDEALRSMDRAIDLRQIVTPGYEALLPSLFNKLALLALMGRLADGLAQLGEAERLLALLKPSYGKAVYLDQIAIYHEQLEAPERALPLWEEVYQMLLDEYTATHLVTAFAQHKLAYVLIKTGQAELAREHLRAAYAVLRTRLGREHEVVQALAAVQAQGQQAPAFRTWSLMSFNEIDQQRLPDRSAEVLRMLVGSEIVPVFDPDEGSHILDRIGKMRIELLNRDAFLLPNIRIMDSTELAPRDYVLQLKEVEIFRRRLPSLYAIPSPGGKKPSLLNRKITQEPGFSFPLLWIDEEAQLPADARIYKAEEIIIANLMEVIGQERETILAAL